MKYVVSWTPRASATEETATRSLQVFGKWSAAHPEHFREFLGRIDGNGGFAVVETDDATEILKDISPFSVYFEFQVLPCLEIADQAMIDAEAMGFLQSVS